MAVFQGEPSESQRSRFAIVVARYNESITGKLLEGALGVFRSHGVSDASIDVIWVPGAWEIPVIVARLAISEGYDSIVCLGAVIRGETTHDRYINQQVSHSLGQLALDTGLPIIFGILTCETLEQAIHRAGGNAGNKGEECALAALEMVSLISKLP